MPTEFRLIGITGHAGSGKDTAAQVLIEQGFSRIAFAEPMRAMLYALNPVIWVVGPSLDLLQPVRAIRLREAVDTLGWDAAKREYMEIRELLQRLGTEAGRAILGPTIWIDVAFLKQSARTVITDVRFNNEAEAVLSRRGIVINIERPGVVPVNAHSSDAGISPSLITHTVVNDSTTQALHAAILAIATRGDQ